MTMKTKFNIENACCEGCKKSIETHTATLPGLNSLVYDLETKTAEADHEESLSVGDIITKIGSIGKGNYKASVA